MDSRPLILICNDDGVTAPGLYALIDFVLPLGGDIVAVAPSGPRSGASASLTAETLIRAERQPDDYRGARIFSVTGTPVDCVKLALSKLLPRQPDLMLSGINHGSNAGNCVVYSGTMGAAGESAMAGIPSVGFSLLHHSWAADFSQCAKIVEHIGRAVLSHGMPHGVCLNVNIPARCTPEGIKVVRAARCHWTEDYKEYLDPSGRTFYMLSGELVNDERDNAETDLFWLDRNYATVVPYAPERTDVNNLPYVSDILAL